MTIRSIKGKTSFQREVGSLAWIRHMANAWASFSCSARVVSSWAISFKFGIPPTCQTRTPHSFPGSKLLGLSAVTSTFPFCARVSLPTVSVPA
eukprot:1046160-Rhodomonas_salina.1